VKGRKIRCDHHGESLWNGQAVCDCGRAHLLSLIAEEGAVVFGWSCDCGREDPVESRNLVCAVCYRQISGTDYYGPN
jgi:hypothetical protein